MTAAKMERSRRSIWSGSKRDPGAHMKQFLVAVLTVVTPLSSICANLDDGSDRIEDRYGNLVQRQLRDDGTVSGLYHKGRYFYLVVFANGRSVSESYSH